MFKGKKIIVFDMDGTLIDSIGVWNNIDALLIEKIKENDYPIINSQKERDIYLKEHRFDSDPYMGYCGHLGKLYGSKLSASEIYNIRYDIAEFYLNEKIDYKENADILIKKLYDYGFILVIASTTKRITLNKYMNTNKNIINKADIKKYFTLTYTKEDAVKIKPDPEIFLKVKDELNAKSSDILIFEDSLVGAKAGSLAGIDLAIMYDKYSDLDREEINKLANYNFNNYNEVISLLDKEMSE